MLQFFYCWIIACFAFVLSDVFVTFIFVHHLIVGSQFFSACPCTLLDTHVYTFGRTPTCFFCVCLVQQFEVFCSESISEFDINQALERDLAKGDQGVQKWFQMYVPNICDDLSLGAPDTPHAQQLA